MPQLDATTYGAQLFWLGILFCLTYAFVRLYFYPRFQSLMDMREEHLGKKLKEAKNLQREATTLADQMDHRKTLMEDKHKRSLDAAFQKSKNILFNTKHHLEKNLEEALKAFEKESRSMQSSFAENSKKEEALLTGILFEKLTTLSLESSLYEESTKRDCHVE